MPALWQASQRPMYIRTVWIDGFRHAILTHDDPHYIELNSKRRRPHSSASFNPKRKSQGSRLSHRSDCNNLRNLDLVIRSDKIRISHETDIEKLNFAEIETEDESILSTSPLPVCDFENLKSKFESIDMRVVKSNRTARIDVRENNDLSDRVLQWLDLAGKVDLLANENAERISQPRHSWPEIQKRNLGKSRTVTDLRVRECKLTASDSKTNDTIDREEVYMPTSATTIENYARQSRNRTTSRDSHAKIKENKKVKDIRQNVAEARQKMIAERSAMEKQYAELVNKKIIPNLAKTKKQVHIFMPEAIPNKVASNTTGSLLSHKSKS
ncbi:PREDICTED: uncharacterized protein LOC106108596 [Papilio polytes]|uniref:uncharacterized protein LOC106108596 n=1 Tax=Papilio polytes TaxID=76194 RepID=UPI000675F26F|nr:PREDICTED: uncharacterized protein LOC106108596 [Papilio polytes]XP_013145289.1 PREDICTED: uncharacterized protein LOC106108596 [Papilio polytes]XP_013145290.1 PREDICTED: uncharacterized protein LOC106108596 [Papilio polytes]